MKFNKSFFIGIFLLTVFSFVVSSQQLNVRMSHENEELKIKNELLEQENKKLKESVLLLTKNLDEFKFLYDCLEIKYYKALDKNDALEESIKRYEEKIQINTYSCDERKKDFK